MVSKVDRFLMRLASDVDLRVAFCWMYELVFAPAAAAAAAAVWWQAGLFCILFMTLSGRYTPPAPSTFPLCHHARAWFVLFLF